MENKKIMLDDVLKDSDYLGENELAGCHIYVNREREMLLTGASVVQYFGYDRRVEIPYGVKRIWPGAFNYKDRLESVVIPDSVEKIDDYAFFFCPELQDVQFGNNVKYVGKRAFKTMAFEECSLFIDLPDSVEFVGEEAFMGCTVAKLPQNLKHIGAGAFSRCAWVASGAASEWYAEIPEGVITIGEVAFAEMCLDDDCKGIRVPVSVKKIGKGAFRNIYGGANKNTVYYAGSEEQFKAIEIDNTDDWLKNIKVEFNRA